MKSFRYYDSNDENPDWIVEGHIIKIPLDSLVVSAPGNNIDNPCLDPQFSRPLRVVGPDPNAPERKSWASQQGYRFAVNTSFFDPRPISSTQPEPANPHDWKCTKLYGYTVGGGVDLTTDEKVIASIPTNGRPMTQELKTAIISIYVDLVATQGTGQHAFFSFEKLIPVEIRGRPHTQFESVAFTGARLIENNEYVGDQLSGPRPECMYPRTAAGLSQDNKTLIFVVVNPGFNNKACDAQSSVNGAPLRGLAEYMISEGVANGINLDGGGSSQFYWNDPGCHYASGCKIQSKASDEVNGGNLQYRPVVNVLGIR